MKRALLFIGLLLCVFTSVRAQEKKFLAKEDIYKSLNVSYVYGVQIYNDNMIYNPGYSTQLSIGNRIHKDVAVGVGAGYIGFNKEHFLPIFFEIIGNKKKKDNTPFIRLQAGYSLAWNETETTEENYDLHGGLFFNAGLGRKIKINDKYAVLLHWSLCHQFAEMEYSIFGMKNYREELNYDMIQISASFMFN